MALLFAGKPYHAGGRGPCEERGFGLGSLFGLIQLLRVQPEDPETVL